MATIGFVGLGHMGLPMARNLIKAGHAVQGYDVSTAAVGALARAGGTGAASVAKAVAGAEMRRHHAARGPPCPGGLHRPGRRVRRGDRPRRCSSTARPSTSRPPAPWRRRRPRAASPWSTRRSPAGSPAPRPRTLTFMVGGPEPAFARAQPLLAADGQGRDPCRRRRQRSGGQDLQQHDAGHPDDLGLRGHGAGAAARACAGAAVRDQPRVLRPVLVADQLLPGARAGAVLAGQPRLSARLHHGDDAQGPASWRRRRPRRPWAPARPWVRKPTSSTACSRRTGTKGWIFPP